MPRAAMRGDDLVVQRLLQFGEAGRALGQDLS